MLRWGLIAGALVYLVLAIASIDVNWSRVAEGLSRGWAFVTSFFNPGFRLARRTSGTASSKA
jgi:phosphonate transport system permease protein